MSSYCHQVGHKIILLPLNRCHGEKAAAHHCFLTFSGMPNIFTFVLGRGALKMEQSVQHIAEELLKDLPSANQMGELEVVVGGD